MAVDLALYRVPHVGNTRPRSPWVELARPFIARWRYRRLVDFAPSKSAMTRTGGHTALLLGFSPYMTRDVLAPLAAPTAAGGLEPVILGPPQPTAQVTEGVRYATWSEFWSPAARKHATYL